MNLPEGKLLVLFDGVCNLCNRSVQWLIKRDREDRFRFVPLQSDLGRTLAAERHIDTSKVDSIILIHPGTAYYLKSDAAFEIARQLKGYGWLPVLFGWVPNVLRNAVYDLIARNRYKWFGKKEHCMLPTEGLRAKFLS